MLVRIFSGYDCHWQTIGRLLQNVRLRRAYPSAINTQKKNINQPCKDQHQTNYRSIIIVKLHHYAAISVTAFLMLRKVQLLS